MTYIPDLSSCSYHGGPFDPANWSVPVLAIGWLDCSHQFQTGIVSDTIVSKLRDMVAHTRQTFGQYNFRGMMECSFCKIDNAQQPGPIWSQENLFVPGNNAIYVAPGGIVHYIEAHLYLPPEAFIDAVSDCADVRSESYIDQLRASNLGNTPPFETDDAYTKAFKLKIQAFITEKKRSRST